jgi:hypothetical protein
MKKTTVLIVFIFLGLICSQLHRFSRYRPTHSLTAPKMNSIGTSTDSIPGNGRFQCDGRTHCSQMTSCEEAVYFLKNCPGVEMDGDNDGVPCEKQWCK